MSMNGHRNDDPANPPDLFSASGVDPFGNLHPEGQEEGQEEGFEGGEEPGEAQEEESEGGEEPGGGQEEAMEPVEAPARTEVRGGALAGVQNVTTTLRKGRKPNDIPDHERLPWEGNDFFPLDHYKGWREPVGQMTIARMRNGGEVACTFRFPQTFMQKDLRATGGRGTYKVRLWNAAHNTRLAQVTVTISDGEVLPWPPARPPWEMPDENDPGGEPARGRGASLSRREGREVGEPMHKAFSINVGGQTISFGGDAGSLLTGFMGLAMAIAPALVTQHGESQKSLRDDRKEREDALLAANTALNDRVLALYERIITDQRGEIARAYTRLDKAEERVIEALEQVFTQGIEYNRSFAAAIGEYAQRSGSLDPSGLVPQLQTVLTRLNELQNTVAEAQRNPGRPALGSGWGASDINDTMSALEIMNQKVRDIAAKQLGSGGGGGGGSGLWAQVVTKDNVRMLLDNLGTLSEAAKKLLGPPAQAAQGGAGGAGMP